MGYRKAGHSKEKNKSGKYNDMGGTVYKRDALIREVNE